MLTNNSSAHLAEKTDAIFDPSNFEKRILLLSIGGSPAVLTETLYGLIHLKKHPFIPTEIHVITSEFGKRQIAAQLFPKGEPDKITELYMHNKGAFQENGLPTFTLDKHVHVFHDPDTNEPLEDTLTPEQCNAAADLFKDIIFEFINKDSLNTSAIHCSLAGGRKTMSFFMGYLFSICGRTQDKLSHTLIEPNQLEFPHPIPNKRFFYPIPDQQHEYTVRKDGKTSTHLIDAKDINIHIVDIPYAAVIRDTAFLKELEKNSYSESIEKINTFIDIRYPKLNFDDRTVAFGNIAIELDPRTFAFYCALLEFENGIDPAKISLDQARFLTNVYCSLESKDQLHSIINTFQNTDNDNKKIIGQSKEWAKVIRREFSQINGDITNFIPPRKEPNKPYTIPYAKLMKAHNPLVFSYFKEHLHKSLQPDADSLLQRLLATN